MRAGSQDLRYASNQVRHTPSDRARSWRGGTSSRGPAESQRARRRSGTSARDPAGLKGRTSGTSTGGPAEPQRADQRTLNGRTGGTSAGGPAGPARADGATPL